MRSFVVLYFVAIAVAQYDYSPHNSNVGGTADYLGTFGNSNNAAVGDQNGYSAPVADSEYEKMFFSFSAPEDVFDDGIASAPITNVLKKNLRVIFIKNPENTNLEKAAIQLGKTIADERTAIYVLNKQTDVNELANKLSAIKKNNNNKPEVHFVKYRTSADAENAQRTIQSHYDSLPGTSSGSNDATVPVLDFTSKTSVSATSQSDKSKAATHSNIYTRPKLAYLPPSRLF